MKICIGIMLSNLNSTISNSHIPYILIQTKIMYWTLVDFDMYVLGISYSVVLYIIL